MFLHNLATPMGFEPTSYRFRGDCIAVLPQGHILFIYLDGGDRICFISERLVASQLSIEGFYLQYLIFYQHYLVIHQTEAKNRSSRRGK